MEVYVPPPAPAVYVPPPVLPKPKPVVVPLPPPIPETYVGDFMLSVYSLKPNKKFSYYNGEENFVLDKKSVILGSFSAAKGVDSVVIPVQRHHVNKVN